MSSLIYLDYAATTPVDPRVAEVLAKHLTMDGVFANPASRSHLLGWQAEAAVEKARKQVAQLLNADTREIVWTSGATEANNLAIKGLVEADTSGRKHLISSLSEHKAVIDCFSYLEQHGYEVTWLEPSKSGFVELESVKSALRPDTLLVSLMHVNNETGAVTDIASIGELVHAGGAFFHVDAAQSAGKLALDMATLKVDMLSICAHKIYGPKGVGALYVRRNGQVELAPQIHGGGHERGMRSGTLATHQIAAMGEALALAAQEMSEQAAQQRRLKSMFLELLADVRNRMTINGDVENGVPGILNLGFPGLDGQLLLSALPNLAISSGSACTSASMSPSHVLSAMGVPEDEALSSLRFSFGRYTTEQDIRSAAASLSAVLAKLGPK